MINMLLNYLNNSRYPKVEITVNILITFVLTYAGTHFASIDETLSSRSWGGGYLNTTWITAFATLEKPWLRIEPNAARATISGAIEHETRIPRTSIVVTADSVLPSRGIGYDALLGFITALRSLGSSELIYDFVLFVRLQHLLLFIAIACLPFTMYIAHRYFHTPKTFTFFNIAYMLVLLYRPNSEKFLTEGIIDNALVNACALLGVGCFVLVILGIALQTKWDFLRLFCASLFLGYCTLIRGEFLFLFLFVYVFLFAMFFFRETISRKGLFLSVVVFFSIPIGNGLMNKVVFGHFIPLRIHSGQNLIEPIGQRPNPYGIKWDDLWMEEYLSQRGIKYISAEADDFLTKQYFQLLLKDPGLFFRNFLSRLRLFSAYFSPFINIFTIPLLLGACIYFAYRDKRLLVLSLPLVLAIGYLLFFGWLNDMIRLVSPVHFLINASLCFLGVFILIRLLLHSTQPLQAQQA